MQYTIRNVPKSVDRALRAKAKAEGKSLNEVAIEVLHQALGLRSEPVRHHDLDWMIGTWVEDPAFDEIMREQDQVNPDDWK